MYLYCNKIYNNQHITNDYFYDIKIIMIEVERLRWFNDYDWFKCVETIYINDLYELNNLKKDRDFGCERDIRFRLKVTHTMLERTTNSIEDS